MGAPEHHLVEEIRQVISSCGFRFTTERDLQEQISGALSQSGIDHEREVELAPGDIIDFMFPGLGLEVKIKGSLAEVTRQLHRYAECDQVQELILLTTRVQLGNQPSTMCGKPLHIITIYRGLL